jgi:hypothetical protein
MIFTFIITVFAAFINLVLGFLPSGTLPQGALDSITYFAGAIYKFNDLFPVASLFTVLFYSVFFQFGILLFKSGNWVINKLRGSGT